MRLPRSSLLTLAALAVFMASFVGSAIAQTTNLTHLMVVNGGTDGPVDVAVNGQDVATQLDFATASDPAAPAVVTAGPIEVSFDGAVKLSDTAPADSAWTIVDGYGQDPDTAMAYPTPIAPITSGSAIVAVWNASPNTLDITVDGTTSSGVAPGQEVAATEVPAGQTVTVEADGQSLEVTPDADNYVSVFVVNSGTQTGIAAATIPSMQALVDGITPPPLPTVPDVTGTTEAEATQTLLDAGYVAASATEPSDTVEAGLVTRSDPSGGSELAEGGTVTIFVSTGPSTIVVPDVVGLPEGDAVAALEAVGLTNTSTTVPDNEVEVGIVIESNPTAGIEVAPGTSVALSVSSGPEPVEVPNFIGLTVEEAQALADETGLVLDFRQDEESPDPEGIIVDQLPQAGEVVEYGSTVTVLQAPAYDDAWASIKVEPDRTLRAGGINFEVDSVSEVTVLGTSLSAKQVVDEEGFWVVEIDVSTLDIETAHEVLVVGTAEDGTEYNHTFDLPPEGDFVDQVQPEDEGVPSWVWLILLIALVAAIIIGVLLIMNERRGGGDGPDAADAAGVAVAGAAVAAGDEAATAVDSQEAVAETDVVDEWAAGAAGEGAADAAPDAGGSPTEEPPTA